MFIFLNNATLSADLIPTTNYFPSSVKKNFILPQEEIFSLCTLIIALIARFGSRKSIHCIYVKDANKYEY